MRTAVVTAMLAMLSADVDAKERPKLKLRRTPVLRRVPKPTTLACRGMQALPHKGSLPFKAGEELAYEITVGGAYVGRLETKIGVPRKMAQKTVIPLFARARTSMFVSSFQPLEGRYMSLVDPNTLSPAGVRLEGHYGGDPRWEKIRFFGEQRRVTSDYLMRGTEQTRTYTGQHSLTDILTMLYAARRVDLHEGLTGCQDVFGARRLWRMDAKVGGVVEIDTIAGKRRAYEVKTAFDRRPTAGLNNQKRPKFEIDVFMADDATQAPLAFVMRQGGITAEARLVRWSLTGTSDRDWDF